MILFYYIMVDETRGQRSKQCDIVNCNKKGRILAKMGGIDIAYCPVHRKKYGERIINALINSRFNYKLTNFLSGIKEDVFMKDEMFCETCGSNLNYYFLTKTEEMEKIIEYAEENEIDNSLENEYVE